MKERNSLTEFMEQLIRTLKEEERYSTAHSYRSTLNAFTRFNKSENIRFRQLERSKLKQFDKAKRPMAG